jgi:hypothetical protein
MTNDEFNKFFDLFRCVRYNQLVHDICGNTEEHFIFDIFGFGNNDGIYGRIIKQSRPNNKEEISNIKFIELNNVNNRLLNGYDYYSWDE